MSESQAGGVPVTPPSYFDESLRQTTAPIDAAVVPQALAQFVNVTVPPVATGLGILYFIFGLAHFFLQKPPVQMPMTITAFVSGLLLQVIAFFLRRQREQAHLAHFWTAVVAGFVLLNSWLHLRLSLDLLQSTNFMLLIVGTGFFFLSTRWFVGFVLLTLLTWAGTIYGTEIPMDNVIHFIFGLLSASVLATLAHNARKSRLIRLTWLHHQGNEKALDLQAALESMRASELALRTSEAQYRQLSHQLEEQAEALRVANQSLASASKLKDEFLASMSHELRTPLTAILGITESIKENIYGPVSERQTRALENVLESGKHLLDLINDVLDVAKTEAGKLELDIVPADAHMVAEASVRFVQQSATDKGITIHLAADETVKLLLADERRLKQMLINLLNNAVKFTGEGGQIGLELTGDPAQQVVRFTVWDTGIGIREEQMPRLFKPFIQLDSRLSRRYGGTGLGLVLVYRMAEMHGGSIAVESSPGQGSRFTICLPWRKPNLHGEAMGNHAMTLSVNGDKNRDSAVQASSAAYQGNSSHQESAATTTTTIAEPRTLLAIDDHHWSRNWLETVAMAAGYRLTVTDAPGDVEELIAQVQPDLLLIDMQMPPHDSLALLRTLQKEKDDRSLALVAMSALAMPGEEEQALAAGADAYLVKPISVTTLCTIAATKVPTDTPR